METPETIKLKKELDGLNDRLFDMMGDVMGLQRDIQLLSRTIAVMYDIIESIEAMYETIEEEEDHV